MAIEATEMGWIDPPSPPLSYGIIGFTRKRGRKVVASLSVVLKPYIVDGVPVSEEFELSEQFSQVP